MGIATMISRISITGLRQCALLLLLGCAGVASAGPAVPARACPKPVSVCGRNDPGSFALIQGGAPSSIVIDGEADPAVRHAAEGFAEDLRRVSGSAASIVTDPAQARGPAVLIGVLGHSPIVDGLVKSGKVDATGLADHWEAYGQSVVDNPMPGVARALVIVGSDRRGAVFGAYDLSRKIGVSPWYWWADVPVRRRTDLFITAGSRLDEPKVKYRGFFINDEEPAFGTWAREKFGGINSKMYGHMFDLLLRLKGNFLWPAMWGKAFNADDPHNMVLADELGVVMGTSHHEPMTRAQAEWHRNTDQGVTGGAWDYTTNAENLRKFWRGGIERMVSKGPGQHYEAVVTVGMRGDGDKPMAEGTATDLLERIVADQRRIIADVTGRPASETPQAWALYKEVQDYYDHGMKVPDDVTLLFADDNWGQVRRLPISNFDRPGGYGVYYHFDYVGGPRNYTWLNTNQIQKVWQQMDLSYKLHARQLWVVNVGDLKPMEFPLSFFMDEAWNPEAMTPERLGGYAAQWAADAFGAAHGAEIGQLLTRYATLVARRKPELVDANSFPLGQIGSRSEGGEFGGMVGEWHRLLERAERTGTTLSPDQSDAYFELVLHPIRAMSNLYDLYYAVAMNRRLAAAGDPRANAFADAAEGAFRKDREISQQYHHIAGGKWDGMMLQVHIGYTTWHEPKQQIMPTVVRVPATSHPGVVPPATEAGKDYQTIEAVDFVRKSAAGTLSWSPVPGLGRTKGAIVAYPQGRPQTSVKDNVRVDYDWSLRKAGDATVQLYMVPTLDTRGGEGLHVAVSVDDRPPQTLTMNIAPEGRKWAEAVENNAVLLSAVFPGMSAGRHTLKIWRIDDNVAVQRIVVGRAPFPVSYLGPSPLPRQ